MQLYYLYDKAGLGALISHVLMTCQRPQGPGSVVACGRGSLQLWQEPMLLALCQVGDMILLGGGPAPDKADVLSYIRYVVIPV
jgi:hypothetical protein